MPVTLYNSLGWKRNETIKLVVDVPFLTVYDPNGVQVISQVSSSPLF